MVDNKLFIVVLFTIIAASQGIPTSSVSIFINSTKSNFQSFVIFVCEWGKYGSFVFKKSTRN